MYRMCCLAERFCASSAGPKLGRAVGAVIMRLGLGWIGLLICVQFDRAGAGRGGVDWDELLHGRVILGLRRALWDQNF